MEIKRIHITKAVMEFIKKQNIVDMDDPFFNDACVNCLTDLLTDYHKNHEELSLKNYLIKTLSDKNILYQKSDIANVIPKKTLESVITICLNLAELNDLSKLETID